MDEPVIRHATAADFPRIVALNAAEVDGEVAAFLLAFRDGANYPNPNFDWFAARYPSFVYVDRLVVDARFNGRGVGSLLYRDLFGYARRTGAAAVTCEFNVVPPNEASARFHARWGFAEVGRQWLDQGRKQVSLQAAAAGESP